MKNAEFQTPIGTGPWMIESCEDGVQNRFGSESLLLGRKTKSR